MLIFTYKLLSNMYLALANTEQLLHASRARDTIGHKC